MTHEQIREVEDDDHDLLTYDESGIRLQEEIATIEDELRECRDEDGRARMEQRRDALKDALQRNTRHAESSPGETGFLTYSPPSRT